MRNADYQSANAISKSRLDRIAPPKTPLHYWASCVDPKRAPEKRTEALIIGDCVHIRGLEPDSFHDRVVAIPKDAPKKPSTTQLKATNPSKATLDAIDYWDDFQAEHKNKVILDQDDFALVLRMGDRLLTHPLTRGLLRGGVAEDSYFAIDPETGALTKCRLDYNLLERAGMILDLKTTEDASESGFGNSSRKYRYPVQHVHYETVLADLYGENPVDEFVFIAIEKEWPHCIGVYFHDRDDESYSDARAARRRDLNKIVECTVNDDWPDYTPHKPAPLRASRWNRAA